MQPPSAFQVPSTAKPRQGCLAYSLAAVGLGGLVCLGGALFSSLGGSSSSGLGSRADGGTTVAAEPLVDRAAPRDTELVPIGAAGPASWVEVLASCLRRPPPPRVVRGTGLPGMKFHVCPDPIGPVAIAARDKGSWLWSPTASIATPPGQFAAAGGVRFIATGPANRSDGVEATQVWFRVTSGPLEGSFLDYQVFEDHRELTVFGPRSFATNPVGIWAVPREVLEAGIPPDIAARCGAERPSLSVFEGELIGSESYVAQTAHDPDSIDVENCTPPALGRQCWESTCDVRGRNAFGAMVLNRMTFVVVRGEVVDARNARR